MKQKEKLNSKPVFISAPDPLFSAEYDNNGANQQSSSRYDFGSKKRNVFKKRIGEEAITNFFTTYKNMKKSIERDEHTHSP